MRLSIHIKLTLKFLFLSGLFLIILLPCIQAIQLSEIQRVTNQAEAELANNEPTFTEIITTVYHTALSDDFETWYAEKDLEYDITTSLRWCVIPIPQRGFFEDVKCQGSGVHEGQIHHTNQIHRNPQDSVPLKPPFVTGKTSQQTNPEPKWTVAVNDVRGSSCFIPYGYLLYIDFGPDNPWTGLYRAEDTGSAFRGECKIDIYAGVGLEASEKAEEYVSGKNPDVYLLGPTSGIVNPRAVTLEANYKFLSSQEYMRKFESSTQPDEDKKRLSLSEVETGSIFTHYSNIEKIKNINNFYNSVKDFSQDLLNACVDLNVTEKDECVRNFMNKLEDYNLTKNKGVGLEKSEAINLTQLSQKSIEKEGYQPHHGFHKITGKVEDVNVKDIGRGQLPVLKIRQISNNEVLEVHFSDFLAAINLSGSEEKFIELKGIIRNIDLQNNKFDFTIGNIGMGTTERWEHIKIDPDYYLSDLYEEPALQIANCAYSKNQTCKCEVEFPKEHEIIKFDENTFYVHEDTKQRVPTTFFAQNTGITQRIVADDPSQTPEPDNSFSFTQPSQYLGQYVFTQEYLQQRVLTDVIEEEREPVELNITNHGNIVSFKKENDKMITIEKDYEPNLINCEIQTKVYLFNLKYPDNNNYFSSTKPKMNFALRI